LARTAVCRAVGEVRHVGVLLPGCVVSLSHGVPPSPGPLRSISPEDGSNDSTSHYPTLVAEGKRAHNCAVYGRRRPAETVHSTALTRRLLTRKKSPHGAWRSSMHGDEGGPRTVVDEALVRTPNFAPDGPQRPAQTLRRTAVGCHLLARRSSLGRPWRSHRVSGQLSETGRFCDGRRSPAHHPRI